jgi:ribokinase
LIDVARHDGIDVSGVVVSSEAPTGRAIIVVSDDGENSIVVIPGANALVTGASIPAAKLIVAQLEVPVPAVQRAFEEAKEFGAITVLNPAPAQELSVDLLALSDVIVPNEHEVQLLGGVQQLHAMGVAAVIVTRGAAGVTLSRPGVEQIAFPAIAVDVVDTTGAGDAFCGNLAARLAAGDPIEDAIRWAVAAGALAVTAAGAVPSLPCHDAVADLLNT